MKRAFSITIFLIVVLFALLHFPSASIPSNKIIAYSDFGQKTEKSNVVGIEPWLTPSHYQSEQVFVNELRRYLDAAQSKGWLANDSIVVFPEHISTWLITADLSAWVYDTSSTQVAMALMIFQSPLQWLRGFMASTEVDSFAAAVFRMHSPKQAARYQSIFSNLAQQYQVTIVAGSLVIENPSISNGLLETSKGNIYNASGVFNSKGELVKLLKKHFPISDEQPFTASADFDEPDNLTINNLNLLPMICADSWFEKSYREYDASKVTGRGSLIVVPSFLTGSWEAPWLGYSGFENPEDVQRSDVGTLTEGQAWLKYAVASKAKTFGFDYAMNVFLQGRLWDMKGSGRAIVYHKDLGVNLGADSDNARMINLWL